MVDRGGSAGVFTRRCTPPTPCANGISSLAIVGSMVHEIHDRPWEFYRDFATQCADEIRHIGLLLRRLEQLGSGPDAHPFPTWNFYDAVAFLPLTERTLVFNAVVEGNVVETLHDRARAFRGPHSPPQ